MVEQGEEHCSVNKIVMVLSVWDNIIKRHLYLLWIIAPLTNPETSRELGVGKKKNCSSITMCDVFL